MSYTPTTWANGDIVAASDMNKIENGIAAVGVVEIADLPSGSTLYTLTSTRPTARTDVSVFFLGATDPGAAALAGDVWLKP